MPRCPFATWKPLVGSSGPYTGGPPKIVHHTTEGPTAEGAFREYVRKGVVPHFTVDRTTIYQHVDTGTAVSALANPRGGVQTNRDSALQFEVVGFAHLPKDRATLTRVGRLCRWLEETHGVPQRWPNGYPKPARNGRDPGGHNRDARTWDDVAGHYGHSQVPENSHWDPGYTAEEVDFIMAVHFEMDGRSVDEQAMVQRFPSIADFVNLEGAVSTMPDHHDVRDHGRWLEEFRPRALHLGPTTLIGLGLVALGVYFLLRGRSDDS